MPLFIYRCPTTGRLVQGFTGQDVSEDTRSYESVFCIVCKRFHLVNPATGAVLGNDDEPATSRDGASSA